MLILCSGPDVFRAQERARELLSHFAQKYDVAQTSVERLEGSGTVIVDQLIERINTPSLFAPRRFLRVSNLWRDCSKAKQAALVQALSRDVEQVIVVSIEEEPLTDVLERLIAPLPRVTRYDFPLLRGPAFVAWVTQLATRLSVTDKDVIQQIAEQSEGDSWRAWNELLIAAAGGMIAMRHVTDLSVYELADTFLQARPEWRTQLAEQSQTPQAMQAFLGQVRALLRVRDGAAQTLPSFIVRKLQAWRPDPQTEERFARVLLYYFVQRSGLANEEEAALMLS